MKSVRHYWNTSCYSYH